MNHHNTDQHPDRHARAFADARARADPLFMPYLPGGFPSPAETVPLIQALFRGGAGAIDFGVPFSDPLADGPTVQRANTIALQQGINLHRILEDVRALRAAGETAPITLMGYLNPFLAYRAADGATGIEALARDAVAVGADGWIIVDLPPEESDAIRVTLRQAGLHLIYLLAPTSTDERIRTVAERASGWIYLVSVTGVTGTRTSLPPDLVEFVSRVRRGTDLPLALGFGLATREQVETVGKLCEAAVIGSAVVLLLEATPPADRPAALQRVAEEITGGNPGRRRE